MLQWICDHTRRDRVRNDDTSERLGVPPAEKLVQHCLRWFEHIQQMPLEAPVHSRGRSNLTWEKSVKRDLKD
jgi:hypothetical protein